MALSQSEQFFVILLERDALRKQQAQNLKSSLGQPLQVFKAVDGSTFTPEQVNGLINKGYLNPTRLTLLNAGQVGMALSVIFLLEQMVRDGVKHLCVFEDDATLVPDFNQEYQRVCAEIPSDYDFLYLFRHPYFYPVGHSEHITPPDDLKRYMDSLTNLRFGDPSLHMPGKLLIEKAIPVCGIVGFRVSLSGAKKILGHIKPVYFPVDDMILHMVQKNTLNAFGTIKPLVKTVGHLSSYETIGERLTSNIWGSARFVAEP